tara:strand:+ start:594 stop:1058 length:465 start_codon:yes stop_codon:yes gene_type:complete
MGRGEKVKNSINHIWVFRQVFKKLSTRGQMYLNGIFIGYTLEDEVRGDMYKVKDHTAIPSGTYQVVKHDSNKFPKSLKLEDVPDFTGIVIHGGNNEEDTSGCILLGAKKDDNGADSSTISDCYKILKSLSELIRGDIDDGIPCYITITNSPKVK